MLARAIVDQCQFGLCDPESKRLYGKRTCLDCNSTPLAMLLEEGGRCCHQPHEHQPVEGSVKTDNGWFP